MAKAEPTDYAQILDKIAAEIEEQKKRKAEFLASYKRAISQLLIVFCVIEIVLVIWYYFHQKPSEFVDHLLHILPLLLVPIVYNLPPPPRTTHMNSNTLLIEYFN